MYVEYILEKEGYIIAFFEKDSIYKFCSDTKKIRQSASVVFIVRRRMFQPSSSLWDNAILESYFQSPPLKIAQNIDSVA